MFPQQKFDKPGKSPFMDMQLVPKHADEGAGASGASAGVSIDPSAMQNLGIRIVAAKVGRSEEHTSELQSLMRNTYAVFCLKKKIHFNRKYTCNTSYNIMTIETN